MPVPVEETVEMDKEVQQQQDSVLQAMQMRANAIFERGKANGHASS